MPYRGRVVTVGLLAVWLGVGACGGGGGAEHLGCCNGDSPSCACFDDTGSWDPSSIGYLQDIARETLGTHDSCETHGGKPYYQMRLGLNSPESAQLFACALQEASSFIDPEFALRDDWCSEAISYWHREASLPYVGGYRGSEWVLDWQLDTTDQLETFYRTEESRIAGRGRWIHWTELDYSDFRPGINAPVPGSYILIRKLKANGDWDGGSHSMMVDEMTIYQTLAGEVDQVHITILEGNWIQEVIDTKVVDDIRDHTIAGSSTINGGRKIRGFGVDLDASGTPIYDPDRLHVVYLDEARLLPPPPPDPSDLIWETHLEPLIPELAGFADNLDKHQGPGVSTSPPGIGLTGIPNGVSTRWTFPEDLAQIAPEGFEVTIDLRAEHPLRLTSLLFQWTGSALPQGYQVRHAGQDGTYRDAHVPQIGKDGMLFRPDGFAAMPIPVVLENGGAFVRTVRVVFPPGSLDGVKTLEELRFRFDYGPRGDDSSFSE